MARIDDYKKAFELGKQDLIKKDPKQIADDTHALFDTSPKGKQRLSLDFLNQQISISWPDLEFSINNSNDDLTIQQQILLLHYLKGASHVHVTGDWIAYQEIPDGKFYLDAFLRRAKNPLVQGFGNRPEQLVKLAKELYGAEPFDQGDVSVKIQALPLVPIALILWEGDDEFPPEGNILFDRSISRILSAEDTAWLSGMVIYPLIGFYKEE